MLRSPDWTPSPRPQIVASESPSLPDVLVIRVILFSCVFRDAERTRECSGVHDRSNENVLATRMDTGYYHRSLGSSRTYEKMAVRIPLSPPDFQWLG